jgi:hypothetical protein
MPARLEMADILRRHGPTYRELHAEALSREQLRVIRAIEQCRTAALGGHVEQCDACGHQRIAYNSCRNRHCPKCQALAQQKWIDARSARMLPVRHFHVVFTLPSELRALCKRFDRKIYDALLRAAGETLLDLGKTRLGATVGVTLVLHTWRRDLGFHPHVHAIVSAGGLSLDRARWIASSTKYLFPVDVMGALLRGKMMEALRRLHARGIFAHHDDFRDPQGFDRLMARLAKTKWLVYAKKPFRRADHVLAYLGRYTHRVGISNSRLVEVSEHEVTFRTKNAKTVTLDPVEFLSRFVQHVLPPGFKKIRHCGLYASSSVNDALERAHTILDSSRAATTPSNDNAALDWPARLRALTGRDVTRCPRCNAPLDRVALPPARAPPRMIIA